VRGARGNSRPYRDRKKDRPQLAAALADCRARRAVLVIAKLDRLTRNVHFAAGLMESGVEFVASDMPSVNRLTVYILAAVAEEETRIKPCRMNRGCGRSCPSPLWGSGDVASYAGQFVIR